MMIGVRSTYGMSAVEVEVAVEVTGAGSVWTSRFIVSNRVKRSSATDLSKTHVPTISMSVAFFGAAGACAAAAVATPAAAASTEMSELELSREGGAGAASVLFSAAATGAFGAGAGAAGSEAGVAEVEAATAAAAVGSGGMATISYLNSVGEEKKIPERSLKNGNRRNTEY